MLSVHPPKQPPIGPPDKRPVKAVKAATAKTEANIAHETTKRANVALYELNNTLLGIRSGNDLLDNAERVEEDILRQIIILELSVLPPVLCAEFAQGLNNNLQLKKITIIKAKEIADCVFDCCSNGHLEPSSFLQQSRLSGLEMLNKDAFVEAQSQELERIQRENAIYGQDAINGQDYTYHDQQNLLLCGLHAIRNLCQRDIPEDHIRNHLVQQVRDFHAGPVDGVGNVEEWVMNRSGNFNVDAEKIMVDCFFNNSQAVYSDADKRRLLATLNLKKDGDGLVLGNGHHWTCVRWINGKNIFHDSLRGTPIEIADEVLERMVLNSTATIHAFSPKTHDSADTPAAPTTTCPKHPKAGSEDEQKGG